MHVSVYLLFPISVVSIGCEIHRLSQSNNRSGLRICISRVDMLLRCVLRQLCSLVECIGHSYHLNKQEFLKFVICLYNTLLFIEFNIEFHFRHILGFIFRLLGHCLFFLNQYT